MTIAFTTRRTFVASAVCGMFCAGMLDRSRAAPPDEAEMRLGSEKLAVMERQLDGRLGVFGMDTGSGATIAYRADELFPMCSTHKVQVGGAILALVETGQLKLDQPVRYTAADLLDYSPVAKRHVDAGFMTVEALCEAAIRWSDNSANNLLLKLIGGPVGWTRFVRSLGDGVSRLDRFEPDLNSSIPGDVRDTSSPRAMNRTIAGLLFGNALSDGSRSRLKQWMYDSDLTKTLFRAGLPLAWNVADKSGAGANGSRNDVGILYPPGRAPILLSVFSTGSRAPIVKREAIIARCAGVAVQRFG